MNITIHEVFKLLSVYKAELISQKNEKIVLNDTRLISKKEILLQKDVLYVGMLSQFQNILDYDEEINLLLINDMDFPLSKFCQTNGNVIVIPTNEDVFSIYNEVKDLFTENSQIANSSVALLDSLIHGRGLNYITELGAEILKNPVILIDSSYKVLSHSNEKDITVSYWIKNVQQGYCSYEFISEVKKIESFKKAPQTVEPFPVSCYASNVEKLVCNVIIENKIVGYLIVLECCSSFNDKTKELMGLLSNVISQELRKNRSFKNMKGLMYENVLLDLLDEKISQEEVLHERVKSIGYRFSKHLRLLTIEFSKYNINNQQTNFLRNSLENIFTNSKSVYFQDMIIVLMDLQEEYLSDKLIMELKTFLKDNHLYGGLSNQFSNLIDLKKHYVEGLKALEFGLKFNRDDSLFCYEDFKFYHLLASYHKQNLLIGFCHPAIKKLQYYDQENSTTYYDTLYYYLLNNQNIHQTAKHLFIHRNTLGYRMGKIREIINVDLSDSEVIFQIYLSYKIREYLNHFQDTSTTYNPHS